MNKEGFIERLVGKKERLLVSIEDVGFALRVLSGSEREGENLEVFLEALKQSCPELYKRMAVLAVGAGELKGEKGSDPFFEEIRKVSDLTLLGLLPLYSAAGKEWPIEDEKAVAHIEAVLHRGQIQEVDPLKKDLAELMRQKTGRFFDLFEEMREERSLHPFAAFALRLLLVSAYETVDAEPLPELELNA